MPFELPNSTQQVAGLVPLELISILKCMSTGWYQKGHGAYVFDKIASNFYLAGFACKLTRFQLRKSLW